MADIDLIPASWRAEQRARRTLRGGLVAVGCTIAAVAAVRIGLEIANRQATTRCRPCRAQRRDSERIVAASLPSTRGSTKPANCPAKVAALRGPDVVSGVLVPIDQALGESIWFDELIYTRIPALPQPGTPSPRPRPASPSAAGAGPSHYRRVCRGPSAAPALPTPGWCPATSSSTTASGSMEFALSCPLTPARWEVVKFPHALLALDIRVLRFVAGALSAVILFVGWGQILRPAWQSRQAVLTQTAGIREAIASLPDQQAQADALAAEAARPEPPSTPPTPPARLPGVLDSLARSQGRRAATGFPRPAERIPASSKPVTTSKRAAATRSCWWAGLPPSRPACPTPACRRSASPVR